MRVVCPSCETVLNARDSAAGRRVRCSICGTEMRLPQASQQQVPVRHYGGYENDSIHPGDQYGDMSGVVDPPPRLASDQIRCPHCTQTVSRSSQRCPYCDRRLNVSRQSGRGRKRARQRELEEGDISLGEGLICVLLPGIGLIIGLIYLASGDPKARKMLLFSFIVIAIKLLVVGGLILAGGAP